jgi:hypothetical protein
MKLDFQEAVDWCSKTFNIKSDMKMETQARESKPFKPVIAIESK